MKKVISLKTNKNPKKFHELRTFKLKCAIKKDKEEYYQCMTGKNIKFDQSKFCRSVSNSKSF